MPTKKSDLLCLDGPAVESPVNVHVKIFDGPAIVHSLNNKQVTTFDEYGDNLGQISSFTSVIGLTSFGIDMYLVVSKNRPERRGGKVSEERCKPKQSYQLIIQTFLEIHQTKQNCLNFNGYVNMNIQMERKFTSPQVSIHYISACVTTIASFLCIFL